MTKITRKLGNTMPFALRIILVVLVVSITGFGASAQISFNSTEELKEAANQFFENQEYEKAKPLFSQLLSKDALDPNYNYRFGVCIMFSEAEPLKPLPYIEGAANSAGVNPEAHYFLGRIYQLNYRFDDAIKAYQKAKIAGYSKPNINVDRQIQECRNGKILFNAEVEFDPAFEKDVIESEFYRPYDFRKLKGKVIPMPPSFKTKYDLKNLHGTFVYTPTSSSVLFFASLGEDGAYGKDLYKVNRLPNGEWAIAQRLPNTINTKYDEDFGFFDEIEQTLYFASKGHNTMGGYDVFSSKYDSKSDSWSTPLNLQYPINSPYDDFLYVSDPNGKLAFFTSSRNSALGKLKVFKTLLVDPLQIEVSIIEGKYSDQIDSVYNYMAATITDPITNEVVGKYRSHKITGKYVMVLPPKNDYSLDIGPKEAEGFKFDLDVPKHESYKTLKQEVSYQVEVNNANVLLTNYFNASGKEDSVSLLVSRNVSEVQEQMVAMPAYVPPVSSADQIAAETKAKADSDALADQLTQEEEAKKQAIKQREEKLAKAELQAKEKAKNDSVAQAQELARVQKENKERKRQELADAAAKQQAVQDSILQAEELAIRKKARQDSILNTLKAKAADRRRALKDSLTRVNELAKIELARKDSIEQQRQLALKREKEEKERLVELERQKLDSILAVQKAEYEAEQALKADDPKPKVEDVEEAKTEENEATASLLAELEENEGEILASTTNKEDAKEDNAIVVEESSLAQENSLQPQTQDAGQISKESKETEVADESDLFLATLARLEQQQQAQDSLIAAENQETEEKKNAESLAAKEVKDDGNEASEKVQIAESSSDEMNEIDEVIEETTVGEEIALKSDADPNDYLSSLKTIEEEMAEESASRPDKTYELQDLESSGNKKKEEASDPALQAKIEEDRKAIAAHQKIAQQKEQRLKDKLEKDREVLELYSGGLANELEMAEQEFLNEPLEQGNPYTEKSTSSEIAEVVPEALDKPADIEDEVSEAISTPKEAEATESAFATIPVADNKTSENTEIPESLLVEEEEMLNEIERSIEANADDLHSTEESILETEILNPKADEKIENAETVVEIEIAEEVEPTKQIKRSENIHLLTAALRDYGTRKVSFDGIEDRKARRMVQMMRAEDVGRLGVLKNIRNAKIDAEGDQQLVKAIEENKRNLDVLANAPKAQSREEVLRRPFNKNDLKERQGVFYKLAFNITTSNVSETIQNAMEPELLATFFMPEFNLQMEYYKTLADARSGYFEYRNKGLSSLSIVPYLNGNLIAMDQVDEIPFVD